MASTDCSESLHHAGIDVGEVEFVDAVEGDEPGERFLNEGFIVRVFLFGDQVRVSQRTAHQRGCTVADVGGDGRVFQAWLAEVGKHGVDGVGEIDARVDQGSVEVEDEEFWGHSTTLLCRKGKAPWSPRV